MWRAVGVEMCPYKIGDKIRTTLCVAGSTEGLYKEQEVEITNIVIGRCLKSSSNMFLYELENSGVYQCL